MLKHLSIPSTPITTYHFILKEPKRRSLRSILTRVFANYLKDQFVVLDNPSDLCVKQIFADVGQASVVGPLLCNLVYDGLFARFDSRVNLKAITFTDNLAIVTSIHIRDQVTHCGQDGTQMSAHPW